MIVELADGRRFRLPDDLPDDKVDAFVKSKMAATKRTAPAPQPKPVARKEKPRLTVADLREALLEAEHAEADEHRSTAELTRTVQGVLEQMREFHERYDGLTAKTIAQLDGMSERITALAERMEQRGETDRSEDVIRELSQIREAVAVQRERPEPDHSSFLTELTQRISSLQKQEPDPAVYEELKTLRNDINAGLKQLNENYMAETRVVIDPDTGQPIGSRRVKPGTDPDDLPYETQGDE
jgi:hypothetical protein